MGRYWLFAFLPILLFSSPVCATNPQPTSVWQLDVRQHGYRVPIRWTRECLTSPYWHCEDVKTSEGESDFAQLGFLDDDTIAVFFNTARNAGTSPAPLRSLFVDAHTGKLLRVADWQLDSPGMYFQPTLERRFLWHMSRRGPFDWRERLAVYAPDLTVLRERNEESHSLTLSHTRKTMLRVSEFRSRTEFRSQVQVVDAASLDTIREVKDAGRSDVFTVYDQYDDLLVRTTHLLGGGNGEISIELLGRPPRVIYTSSHRDCYPKAAYFLTNDLLFVNEKWNYWECPIWLLMTVSGDVVHLEKMDKNEKVEALGGFGDQPLPSQTSYSGTRFALVVTKRKAGFLQERALAHRVAERVVIFDTELKRQVFEYRLKPLPQQHPFVALSPDGKKLAIFSDGRLQVFAVQ